MNRFRLNGGTSGSSRSFFAAMAFLLLFFTAVSAETLPRGTSDMSIVLTGGGIVRQGIFLPAFHALGARDELYLGPDIFASFDADLSSDGIVRCAMSAGVRLVKRVRWTEAVYHFSSSRPSLDVARRLADCPGIRWVESDFYRPFERRGYRPADPFFPNQWYLENIGQTGIAENDARIAAAWEFLFEKGLIPGQGVAVGIIDDGFDLAHRDLADAFLQGIDLADGDDIPMIGPYDLHGTAVAGLLGARWNNGIGIAGVCPHCLVVPVRVSSDLINGATEIEAFTYLLDRGVDIISNSWGPSDHGGPMELSETLKEIFATAAAKGRNGKGTIILFAAGNGNEDISSPESFDGFAANPWVIAIGAVNASGVKTLYSDWGKDLDLMAPSCDTDLDDFEDPFDIAMIRDGIWTTDNTGFDGYDAGDYTPGFCGTSAATPIAAGVVGLLLSASPDLSWQEVYDILTTTADKVSPRDARYDENGFSLRYGYGRINAIAAIEKACDLFSCPGRQPVAEEPIEPLEPDALFVEAMGTLSDDDTPLAGEGPSESSGGCALMAL